MKAVILYDEERYARNKKFAEMLSGACAKRGIDSEILLKSQLDFNNLPDLIIRRCVDNELTEQLENCGIRVVNGSRVSRIANDKGETYRFFAPHGIKMCKTLRFDTLPEVCPIPFPCIIKAADGHGGTQVFKAESNGDYTAARTALTGISSVLQPFLNFACCDVRAYVLGGKLLCAVKRTAESGFKSNFSLGGKAEAYYPSEAELAMIEQTSALLSTDFVGVDFFPNGNEPVLNEIEDVVGTRMLYALDLCDAADVFIGHIVDKYCK